MIDVNAYLFFNGNCAEVMRFYEKTLGGKLRLVTGKDMPGTPPEQADAIMHARLDLDGGGFLMASDWMSPDPYPGMSGFRVCLSYPSTADASRVFNALAAGASIQMPFQKTSWSPGFGMLADRYGTPWMVTSEEGQQQ